MASFATRAHSDSCTACCLPSSQILFCRDAPQIVRLQWTVNCGQQHNYCTVGREETEGKNEFLLEEENPSGRKLLPSCRTLLCPFCIYKIICWSAHSLSFCSSGPVLEYTICSSWFSVICALDDSAASCLFHVTDEDIKQGMAQQVPLQHSICCSLPGRVWPITITLLTHHETSF